MAFFARTAESPVVGIILAVAAVAVCRRSYARNIGLLVASMALQGMMRARQRVARLLVVIEAPACPSVRVVTRRTIRTEPPDVMRILVAARAGAGRILERRAAMTFLARDYRVQPDQGKSRQIVVEGDLLAPARLVVALLASLAELAFVRIILAMAGDAGHGQFVAIEVTGVTTLAAECGVTAAQWELRRLVVVEADQGPLLGGMAAFAIVAIPALMLVLQAVTGNAGR